MLLNQGLVFAYIQFDLKLTICTRMTRLKPSIYECIYVLSTQAVNHMIPCSRTTEATSIQDLYAQLLPHVQRIIGRVDWPEVSQMEALATALAEGTAIGASDGSLRTNEGLASHAWVIQA